MLWRKYYPQSQGVVENFNNKKYKESWMKHLQTLYLIEKKINYHSHEWLLISIFTIITDANIQQLSWFKKNFYLVIKIRKMTDEVIMNREKSRKKIIQEIDCDVGDSALITSWLLELLYKRIR